MKNHLKKIKSIKYRIKKYSLFFPHVEVTKRYSEQQGIIYDPVYYTITISFTNHTVINNNCNNRSISR